MPPLTLTQRKFPPEKLTQRSAHRPISRPDLGEQRRSGVDLQMWIYIWADRVQSSNPSNNQDERGSSLRHVNLRQRP
jgi:hypothetical protein